MLTDSFPGVSGMTDSTELRKNLAGLITRNADGTPRAGVFYRGAAAIGAPRSGDMKIDLNVFNAALVRTGPLFVQNDGVTQSPTLSIPASNSIYHVVYAKQRETGAPYSDPGGVDGPIFDFVSSDPGANPDVNQAIGRVPAGGLPLVSVLVPATAVTTSSAGVVVKDIAPFTSTAGAPVPFRTFSDVQLWTNAPDGQLAWDISTRRFLMFKAGAPGVWGVAEPTMLGFNAGAKKLGATTPGATIATVTATSFGGPIIVDWTSIAFNGNSGSDRGINYQVTCDGAIVDPPFETNQIAPIASTPSIPAGSKATHTPAAGQHTWALVMFASINNAVYSSKSSLTITELPR